MILGICGFIGSGKNTIGDYLVKEKGWESISFAKSLKDATANIFGWERKLLEGDTEESRVFRETVDTWWSNKLGKNTTPRWILQHLGTDVLRHHFADNIWVWATERVIANSNKNIVITDVRFKNEIKMLNNLSNSYTAWVQKGNLPLWYEDAVYQNKNPQFDIMKIKWPDVHESEWAWIGSQIDYEIMNNGSLTDLYKQIDDIIFEYE